MAEKWMQKAFSHSHGQFKAKAKKAGMSTAAYASKEAHNPHASTKTKRQANLAKLGMKYGGGHHKDSEHHSTRHSPGGPANNDGYVPTHPEPGHGDNPHHKQAVKLWQHSQGEGCYDTSAHPDQDCFGPVDRFHRVSTEAHIRGGESHSYGYDAHRRSGHLRMSGVKGAHRIGKR